MIKTTVPLALLVSLSLAICACDGSSGGGGNGGGGNGGGGNGGGSTESCNLNTTCGGNLDGTWQIDTTCVVGNIANEITGQQDLPSACSNLFQNLTLSLAGTVKFAGGMETDNLTEKLAGTILYTSACVAALDNTSVTLTATICSALQSGLLNSSDFSTATCSFTGGNCACSVSSQQQPSTTPGAYTVSGSRISYGNGSSPMDYCVQDTTLMTAQSDGSDLTIYNTAHKL